MWYIMPQFLLIFLCVGRSLRRERLRGARCVHLLKGLATAGCEKEKEHGKGESNGKRGGGLGLGLDWPNWPLLRP